MSSRVIKMTTRDSRFGSQAMEVTAITASTPVADLSGTSAYLRYIQFEKNSSTLAANGQAYLNVYNTGNVDVSSTEPYLRIRYPHIDSSTTSYATVLPFGLLFGTTISFSLTEKDKTALGGTGAMTVRMSIS